MNVVFTFADGLNRRQKNGKDEKQFMIFSNFINKITFIFHNNLQTQIRNHAYLSFIRIIHINYPN
jgi:hypothetical protein